MKPLLLITFGVFAGVLAAPAQFNFNFSFNSGSTGTTALNITTNTTLDLPPDGILHYTTINVSNGATLRFNRNAANTPVYLLALGDVNIAGTIDVSGFSPTSSSVGGQGGPGGFDGGFPAFNGLRAGDGYGPGGGGSGDFHNNICGGTASSAGPGTYSTLANNNSASQRKGLRYGSQLLVPLVGGSGGGGANSPGLGGGGGGGAVLIASSTRISVSGTIRADGGTGATYLFQFVCGPYHLNPGSGGAIRLLAPVVAGSGLLSANGPTTGGAALNNFGRVRVDSIDRRGIFFNATGDYSIGTYMTTFPAPRLDIVEVGGTNIVQGSGPVAIQLPTNSDTNRTVTVQARNFGTMVTNLVVLTPENGPRSVYTNIIDNIANNPATGTVTVGIPPNTIVTISAWKP